MIITLFTFKFIDMKKYLIIPVLALMFGAGVMAQTISFPDVKSGDWFYKDVMNMVEWGVIKGNDDGTFKPQNNVNRAELSAMWNRYDARVQELIVSGGQNEFLDILTTRLDNAEFKNDFNFEFFSAVNTYKSIDENWACFIKPDTKQRITDLMNKHQHNKDEILTWDGDFAILNIEANLIDTAYSKFCS